MDRLRSLAPATTCHRRLRAPLLACTLLMGLVAPSWAGTFVVNSTADPGSGGCNAAECTLREAVSNSNATTGVHDRIEFAGAGSSCSRRGCCRTAGVRSSTRPCATPSRPARTRSSTTWRRFAASRACRARDGGYWSLSRASCRPVASSASIAAAKRRSTGSQAGT